jgi:hypothetical protein
MSNWSTTAFEYGTSTHGAQYRFIDIPDDMNVNNDTTYAISQTSIRSSHLYGDLDSGNGYHQRGHYRLLFRLD